MNSRKRKSGNLGFERRVRARVDPEPEIEFEESDESNNEDADIRDPEKEDSQSSSNNESESESDDGSSNSSSEGETAPDAASSLSFGALARAQAALSSTRHPTSADSPSSHADPRAAAAASRKAVPKRPHKHAPTEMSSKRAVKRGRLAEASSKPTFRDPRFDPTTTDTSNERLDEIKAEKAYGFLHEYRASERESLRAALKKSKDEREHAELGRALASMESREATRTRREEGLRVVAEHRKAERELVKQGKKPFYLKRAEQKKRLLLDRFAGMSAKQVDKAIEKKRKKVTAKERKEMPWARRGAVE